MSPTATSTPSIPTPAAAACSTSATSGRRTASARDASRGSRTARSVRKKRKYYVVLSTITVSVLVLYREAPSDCGRRRQPEDGHRRAPVPEPGQVVRANLPRRRIEALPNDSLRGGRGGIDAWLVYLIKKVDSNECGCTITRRNSSGVWGEGSRGADESGNSRYYANLLFKVLPSINLLFSVGGTILRTTHGSS